MKKALYGLLMLAPWAWSIDIELPPRALLIDRSSAPVQLYQVPLSAVQESGRDLRIESSAVVSGSRERLTLEFPRGTSIDAVFEQLRQNNPRFECQARACGRSNLWANMLYQIPQLYGRDRNQRYQVVETDQGLQTLYVIERGNGEVYAHLERLSENVGAGVVTLEVEQNAGGVLDPAQVSALREAVEAQPELRWELHVQVQATQGYALGLQQARELTQSMRDQTSAIGLQVKNLGPSDDTRITLMGFQP